ncbi:unnamed protein product [Camellia sinensis]
MTLVAWDLWKSGMGQDMKDPILEDIPSTHMLLDFFVFKKVLLPSPKQSAFSTSSVPDWTLCKIPEICSVFHVDLLIWCIDTTQKIVNNFKIDSKRSGKHKILFFCLEKAMESQAFFIFLFSFASLLSSTFLKFSIADDTLASNQSIWDGDTLVSTSQRFELGFFSSGSSKFRYLGIWYKATPDTVVWVANRKDPMTGLQGVLTISGNRSLVLLNGTQSIVWSSNLSRVEEGPVARLLDSGNFVLFGKTETNSDSFLWQSFDFPCNMRIPDLKIGENNRTSLDQYLTSWKSADDPSPGEFTYRVDNHGLPQLVVRMGSIKKYRSGIKLTLINLPLYNNPAFKTMLEFDNNRLIYIYEPYNSSVFTVVDRGHTRKHKQAITQEF